MAWQPEREVWGPERPGLNEIEPLNRVFSESFTDRYRRDGMTGVRVPFLHTEIWRYALEDAAEGAMVWRDSEGRIIGFNMAHRSGAEGWMGPLAVRSIRRTMRGDLVERVRTATDNEGVEQARLRVTNDFEEGVSAMAERREPNFTGT